MNVFETEIIHKRKIGELNGTLCHSAGFRISLSHRVNCSQCLAIIALDEAKLLGEQNNE